MVAPINATADFEAGGETITLTLNFATLDAARKAGADLFKGEDLHPLEFAAAVRCLAEPKHPGFTNDQAFALIMEHGEAAGAALAQLFSEFGDSAEGNGSTRKSKPAAGVKRRAKKP